MLMKIEKLGAKRFDEKTAGFYVELSGHDAMEVESLRAFVDQVVEVTIVPIVVHILHHGAPICGFATGLPRDWPRGHRWVVLADGDQATCSNCKVFRHEIR